jgi:hypothetical protein
MTYVAKNVFSRQKSLRAKIENAKDDKQQLGGVVVLVVRRTFGEDAETANLFTWRTRELSSPTTSNRIHEMLIFQA